MVSRLMENYPNVFFSRVYAEKAYDAVMQTLLDTLSETEHLILPKIGRLDIVVRKSRHGTDPRTHQRILIPEHKAVAFVISDVLKASLNQGN